MKRDVSSAGWAGTGLIDREMAMASIRATVETVPGGSVRRGGQVLPSWRSAWMAVIFRQWQIVQDRRL